MLSDNCIFSTRLLFASLERHAPLLYCPVIHHAFSFPQQRHKIFTFDCWLKGRKGVHAVVTDRIPVRGAVGTTMGQIFARFTLTAIMDTVLYPCFGCPVLFHCTECVATRQLGALCSIIICSMTISFMPCANRYQEQPNLKVTISTTKLQ